MRNTDAIKQRETFKAAVRNARRKVKRDGLGNVVNEPQDPGHVETTQHTLCPICSQTMGHYAHNIEAEDGTEHASAKLTLYCDTGYVWHLSNKLTKQRADLYGAACLRRLFPAVADLISSQFENTKACALCRNQISRFSRRHKELRTFTIPPNVAREYLHDRVNRENAGETVEIDLKDVENRVFAEQTYMTIKDAYDLVSEVTLDQAERIISELAPPEHSITEYCNRFVLDKINEEVNATGTFLRETLALGQTLPLVDFMDQASMRFLACKEAGEDLRKVNPKFFEAIAKTDCFVKIVDHGGIEYVERVEPERIMPEHSRKDVRARMDVILDAFPPNTYKMPAPDWFARVKELVPRDARLKKILDDGEDLDNLVEMEVLEAAFPEDLTSQRVIYRDGYVYIVYNQDAAKEFADIGETLPFTDHAMFRIIPDCRLEEIISVESQADDPNWYSANVVLYPNLMPEKRRACKALIPAKLVNQRNHGISVAIPRCRVQSFPGFDLFNGIRIRVLL